MNALNVSTPLHRHICQRNNRLIVHCSSNRPDRKSNKEKREFLKRKLNIYKKRDIEMIKTRQSEFNAMIKDFCVNDFIALRDIINKKLEEQDTDEIEDYDLPLETLKSTKDDYIRDE